MEHEAALKTVEILIDHCGNLDAALHSAHKNLTVGNFSEYVRSLRLAKEDVLKLLGDLDDLNIL